MRRGVFLRLILIILATILIIGVMFVVDFNLIASNNEAKFIIKKQEHENVAEEYTGLGYKIIKYKISDDEQKFKIGSLLLSYDPDFIKNLSPKIDLKGYIREIDTDSGAFVIYVESNNYATKKYEYDKAYVTVAKETKISKSGSSEKVKKEDLIVGQIVELKFAGDVQELDIVRGTAEFINIIEDVTESGEKGNE